MSDDWQVGDLAVCVDDSPCRCGCHEPELRAGLVLRVSAVLEDPLEGIGLCFEEIMPQPRHVAFLSTRFRKILPDKHEDCEPEFVTLMHRIKRKVSA